MKTKMNIMKNKYYLRLIATWSVCVILLGVGYFVFHLPKKGTLIQIQRQYDESKTQLTLAQKATQEDVCRAMKQQFDKAEKTVRSYSIPQDNSTGLVFEIGQIANELRLLEFSSKNQTIQGLSTLGKTPENVAEVWLEVEFQASFLQLAQFVNRLESQTPAVFVEELTIRRNEDGLYNHEVKMQISFLTTTPNKINSMAMADPDKQN